MPATSPSTSSPKAKEPPVVELSVRLLRIGATATSALKSDHHLKEFPCEVGFLYGGQTRPVAPDWVNFISPAAPDVAAELTAQYVSAVLLVTVTGALGQQRLFALCFGLGHHALDVDQIERQFGLRVVLNSVARNGLRTLDSATLDTTVIQRRTQASRAADLVEFGVDTYRDLLRLASGKPTNPAFAKALSGKDALLIRRSVAVKDIHKLCSDLLSIYALTHYQTNFKFIDNVKPVKEKALRTRLDQQAFNEIQTLLSGGTSDLHLSITDQPDSVGWSSISYYGSGLPSKNKGQFPDVDIADYLDELQKGGFSTITCMEDLRSSHEIRPQDPGKGRVRVYDCIVCEVKEQSKRYVLFDGEWYEVGDQYATEIEDAYRDLLRTPFVPQTASKNEREFIEELQLHPSLLCLDQTRIAPKGAARAQLEACDFLSLTGQLIHLKDGNGAAPLSHLWNQAVVASEALVRDRNAREGMKRAIRDREKLFSRSGFSVLAPPPGKLNPASHPIILGVMRKANRRSGSLDLSFFSKVALNAATRRLSMMGFSTELHLIRKI